MTASNNTSPDSKIDLLALGALVHRLDPGELPFRAARSLAVHVSGGEYNVAANASACFGLRAAIASAMVDYGVGELVERAVREMGVTPIYKRFAHDGVRGPNIATVYSDRGYGVRPPVVFYNRANEAAALLGPGDFNWSDLFARHKVRWFHTGGIFASLSPSTSALAVEALRAARAAGVTTSFDLNYRAKLWADSGGAAGAKRLFRTMIPEVDVLLGDLDWALENAPNSEPERFDANHLFGLAARVRAEHPSVQTIATTIRTVASANRHEWAAVLDTPQGRWSTPTMRLDVLDRIGGGDGFAAGLIAGMLLGRSSEESLRLGWAHGALVTTYPGDVSLARLEEVEALARGEGPGVQR